jgi:hypothetical protein
MESQKAKENTVVDRVRQPWSKSRVKVRGFIPELLNKYSRGRQACT